jgi:hypothetical protein
MPADQLDFLSVESTTPHGTYKCEVSLPYQKHSETSRQAAAKATYCADTQRARILGYIESCGDVGATDKEIQRALELDGSTERPRRIELCQGEHIRAKVVAGQVQKRDGCGIWIKW